MAKSKLNLLDTVALLTDHTDENLFKGQVGTIIEKLDGDTFEVEFSNKKGKTISIAPLNEKELILLHFEAVSA